jgi:hypothetical protein
MNYSSNNDDRLNSNSSIEELKDDQFSSKSPNVEEFKLSPAREDIP